jgi:hypothetical protein
MKQLLVLSTIIIFFNSCGDVRVSGCTDPGALNYMPNADYDNGSCIYGCTDQLADNYNEYAIDESLDICEYSANLVYYLDQSAINYMNAWGISYYAFYDDYNDFIGYITNEYFWTSPPNCLPQLDGSTLTATLYWNGNYNNNLGTFSWQAYPDDGPIADYDNTENNIIPGECLRLQLSKKKIQEYQQATK